MNADVIFMTPGRPLLNEIGRAWLGLQKSSAPELNRAVVELFEQLSRSVGFADNHQGEKHQENFNLILRYAYPEILIDLADLVYVQHERPMVFLNLDHLRANAHSDPQPPVAVASVEKLFPQMEILFRALADHLKQNPALRDDPTIVKLLAESYSGYLLRTKNFPWEDPLQETIPPGTQPVLDVATGLTGFSLIHDWPSGHPPLVLTDSMPFIVAGLNHFKNQTGKHNVEILKMEFPERNSIRRRFGNIHVSKFLHHLERPERQGFLRWALDHLEPQGKLFIIDTDLENRILLAARDPSYRDKLMPGYLETLVPIEEKFCHNLVDDIRELGFTVETFDFHEYHDETDAYSHFPGDDLTIKFLGFEILAKKN